MSGAQMNMLRTHKSTHPHTHNMTDSDQPGFLPEYRSISNKLKKRFLRKPNVSEASEQFRQLGKRLEDNQEPQYAAYCHLAIGQYQSK